MLIGSGCGVPAVMATRTIENERDRRMTIMTTCFIPCGAKLPIIGLIAGAMGLRRGDPAILELSKALTIAVRGDRKGHIATDYQTVSNVRQANGLIKEGRVTSPREYIEDGCFTVFLSADDETLSRINAAMENPVWVPYLGRSQCIPSEPVYRGMSNEFKDLTDAVMHYPLARRSDRFIEYELDVGRLNRFSKTRSDEIQPGKRKFTTRRVWRSSFDRRALDNNNTEERNG